MPFCCRDGFDKQKYENQNRKVCSIISPHCPQRDPVCNNQSNSSSSWGSGKPCNDEGRMTSSNFDHHNKACSATENSEQLVVPSGSYATNKRRYMCKQNSYVGQHFSHNDSPFAELLRRKCRVSRTNFPETKNCANDELISDAPT